MYRRVVVNANQTFSAKVRCELHLIPWEALSAVVNNAIDESHFTIVITTTYSTQNTPSKLEYQSRVGEQYVGKIATDSHHHHGAITRTHRRRHQGCQEDLEETRRWKHETQGIGQKRCRKAKRRVDNSQKNQKATFQKRSVCS